jgi:hypothetical protein
VRLQLTAPLAALIAITIPARAASADEPTRLTTDTLFYTDTDNVIVVSPQVGAHAALDDDGGRASARAVVDVVSAASVDVVSQASGRFLETRVEADLGLAKRLRGILTGIDYRYSHEPDYRSHGLTLTAQRRLGSADTVLSGGYGIILDRVMRSGTPASIFSEPLTTHNGHLSLTQNLGPRTVARAVYTLTVQRGYMEKPYRYVPLFDQAGIDAAANDGVTLDLDTFDRYRLDARPAESVPDSRVRHAAAVRLLRHVSALKGSLRFDVQVYADDWGVESIAVEPAFYSRLSNQFRLAGFVRGYLQTGASFWEREYVVADPMQVPTWRTVDRELSPYQLGWAGARLEWRHGKYSAYLEGSVMRTHYDDYLYLTNRTALLTQAGFRWRPGEQ